MAQQIVVIGGGAAGIGAAGAAKGTDPSADVRVYTEFEDVGYSPCGIPYVHGREIPDFERLFFCSSDHDSPSSMFATRSWDGARARRVGSRSAKSIADISISYDRLTSSVSVKDCRPVFEKSMKVRRRRNWLFEIRDGMRTGGVR